MSLAQEIADTILADVTRRRGWQQEWDGFEPDIQDEILTAWVTKVQAMLDAHGVSA